MDHQKHHYLLLSDNDICSDIVLLILFCLVGMAVSVFLIGEPILLFTSAKKLFY